VVVDMKQHKSQYKIHTLTLHSQQSGRMSYLALSSFRIRRFCR